VVEPGNRARIGDVEIAHVVHLAEGAGDAMLLVVRHARRSHRVVGDEIESSSRRRHRAARSPRRRWSAPLGAAARIDLDRTGREQHLGGERDAAQQAAAIGRRELVVDHREAAPPARTVPLASSAICTSSEPRYG